MKLLPIIRLFALAIIMSNPGSRGNTVAQQITATDLGQLGDSDFSEVSGCAVSRQNFGRIWLHNDGDIRFIYAVRASGEIAAKVRLPVAVEDVEDIALGMSPGQDREHLYVADIGDNDAERDRIQVLCFAEPSLLEGRVEWEVPLVRLYSLKYPDGPHDAETILIDPIEQMLVIVTKDDRQTRLYGVPLEPAKMPRDGTLQLLGNANVTKVSAGDISRDGLKVLLRREEKGWLWSRSPKDSLVDVLTNTPQDVPVRNRSQAKNGEAIGWHPSGTAYVTISEGRKETITAWQFK